MRRCKWEEKWIVSSEIIDNALLILFDEWLNGHRKSADLRTIEATAWDEQRGSISTLLYSRNALNNGVRSTPCLVAQLAQIHSVGRLCQASREPKGIGSAMQSGDTESQSQRSPPGFL
jgi:hypothetical protein